MTSHSRYLQGGVVIDPSSPSWQSRQGGREHLCCGSVSLWYSYRTSLLTQFIFESFGCRIIYHGPCFKHVSIPLCRLSSAFSWCHHQGQRHRFSFSVPYRRILSRIQPPGPGQRDTRPTALELRKSYNNLDWLLVVFRLINNHILMIMELLSQQKSLGSNIYL